MGSREKGFRPHAFGAVSQVTPFLQSRNHVKLVMLYSIFLAGPLSYI